MIGQQRGVAVAPPVSKWARSRLTYTTAVHIKQLSLGKLDNTQRRPAASAH